MPATSYVFAERAVLQALLENTYGSDTSPIYDYTKVPIYNVTNGPIQPDIEVINLNRSKDSLSPDVIAAGRALNALNFTTFVYGTGTAETPPPWAKYLLVGAGFKQSLIASTAPTVSSVTAAGDSGTGPLTGDYSYKFTIVDVPAGAASTDRNETPASAAVTVTGLSAENVDLGGTLGASVATTKNIRVYRTKAGGTGSDPHYYLTEFAGAGSNAVSYTDTTADSGLDQTRTAPSTAAESVIYTPMNQDQGSVGYKVYLNSHLRKSHGARGTFAIRAVAGQPVECVWDFMGLYTSPDSSSAAANPANCAGPGMPPKFENAGAFLIPTDTNTTWGTNLGNSAGSGAGVAISPMRVKSCTFNPGWVVSPRLDANSSDSMIECVIVQRTQARMGMVFEVDSAYKYDPVEDMRLGVTYGGGFTVKPAASVTQTHKRVEITAPKMMHARTPRLVSEDNGILCWDCEFLMTDLVTCHDWARIRIW